MKTTLRSVLCAVLGLSCNAGAYVETARPLHLQLAVVGESWPTARLSEELATWLEEAVDVPLGSSFAVWRLEDGAPAKVFCAETPARWGGGVNRAKARFRRDTVAALDLAPGRASGCRTTRPDGRTRTVLLSDDGRLPSFQWERDATEEVPPAHIGVLCDRSPSMTRRPCTADTVANVLHRWLEDQGPDSTTSIQVVFPGTTAATAVRLTPAVVRGHQSAERLVSIVAEIHSLVATISKARGGSAIAAGMAALASGMAPFPREQTLLVSITDLVEHSEETVKMRDRVPEGPEFSAVLVANGLLRDLAGQTLAICGVERSVSLQGTEHGKLLSAWSYAFEIAGVASTSITPTCEALLLGGLPSA